MLTATAGCSPTSCCAAALKGSVPCASHSGTAIQHFACLDFDKSLSFKRIRLGGSVQYARRYVRLSAKCMLSPQQQDQPKTSKLLTYLNVVNDATKWIVSLTAAGTLLWRHDIYVSWCFLGSIVAVFTCKVATLSNFA